MNEVIHVVYIHISYFCCSQKTNRFSVAIDMHSSVVHDLLSQLVDKFNKSFEENKQTKLWLHGKLVFPCSLFSFLKLAVIDIKKGNALSLSTPIWSRKLLCIINIKMFTHFPLWCNCNLIFPLQKPIMVESNL